MPLTGHLPPSLAVYWQADDGPWDEARAVVAGVCWDQDEAALLDARLRVVHPECRLRVVRLSDGEVLWDTGQDADEWRADAEQERSRPAHAQELPRRRRGQETA